MAETKKTTTCPACYVGLCKKHPRQDAGASVIAKGPADKASTIGKLYDELILKKLAKSRMEAAATLEAEAEAEAYQAAEVARRAAEVTAGVRRPITDSAAAIGLRPISESDSDSGSSSGGGRHRHRSGSGRRRHGDSSSRHRRHRHHSSDDRSRHEPRPDAETDPRLKAADTGRDRRDEDGSHRSSHKSSHRDRHHHHRDDTAAAPATHRDATDDASHRRSSSHRDESSRDNAHRSHSHRDERGGGESGSRRERSRSR